ncbi:hypothetical protein [Bradyrhizobium ganzhouense]
MKFAGKCLSILLSLLSAASVSSMARADEPSPKYAEVLNPCRPAKM